ncbi:MAG: hypothetical protein FJX63_08210, partial [Alphaproteobacteria bacterium]|nr:hypothetical protein [Alphaproteobacteria bacterium]
MQLAAPSEHRTSWILISEDGTTKRFEIAPGDPFRAKLPAGVFALQAEEESNRFHVIVGPARCYLPPWYVEGQRPWGISTHLYALRHRGGAGMGDLETLRQYAETVECLGGKFAGIRPLHHLFPVDRSRVSPYQPSDRRFIDPMYIDIASLLSTFSCERSQSLAQKNQSVLMRLEQLKTIDYAAVWTKKVKILKQVHADFRGHADFDRFVANGGAVLARHCAHEVKTAGEASSPLLLRYHAFLQWVADHQLARAAQSKNLYMDL